MSQWSFVFAAYGLALLATVGLVAAAYRSMRRAESEAEAATRRR